MRRQSATAAILVMYRGRRECYSNHRGIPLTISLSIIGERQEFSTTRGVTFGSTIPSSFERRSVCYMRPSLRCSSYHGQKTVDILL